ncbi:hypothetical protein ABZX90_41540 [Streptomyces sp. NPDC002935]|uniref:hypothetical protein n=1 Tax=Streptomyces sp. NPDC002935 TaxID=3154545 RepID=UPI0033AC0F37
MPTRAIIARPVGGGFAGRYLHRDGAPDSAVWLLRDLVLNVHGGDIEAATRLLLDEHPNGWVSLPASDSDGECFCHIGDDADLLDGELLTQEGAASRDLEYAYVLHRDHIAVLVPDGDGTNWTEVGQAAWSD